MEVDSLPIFSQRALSTPEKRRVERKGGRRSDAALSTLQMLYVDAQCVPTFFFF